MAEPEQCIELFRIMKRLPEVTIPTGKVGVNELLELAHNGSIISLFEFMGERLEVTHDQFLEGSTVLLAERPDNCIVVGFIRINGVLCAASKSTGEEHFDVEYPDEPDVGWPIGAVILTPAFQPIPIIPLQPSFAL